MAARHGTGDGRQPLRGSGQISVIRHAGGRTPGRKRTLAGDHVALKGNGARIHDCALNCDINAGM